MNEVLEKFRQIEMSFNKNYMMTLYQLKQIVEGEEGEVDKKQSEILEEAYSRWFYEIQKDQNSIEACRFYYDAVKDSHELLLKKDEELLKINGDFFSNAFNTKEIDSFYLYNQLTDDTEDDGKQNLWNGLIGLYRLSVLIMVYMRMPLVKQIIDMILIGNPDLNQHNIFWSMKHD